MGIRSIAQNTVNPFIEATEKSLTTKVTTPETAQSVAAMENRRGDVQFYGEMQRKAIENKFSVGNDSSVANPIVLEPTKKQAGTVEESSKVLNGSLSKAGQQKWRNAQSEDVSSSGKGTAVIYKTGKLTPPMVQYDNGFLQNPKDPNDPKPIATIAPTNEDKKYHSEQLANAKTALLLISLGYTDKSTLPDWVPENFRKQFEENKQFLDAPDGIEAYRHFLEGNGADKVFSYEKFVREDESGKIVLANATLDMQKGVEDIYQQMIAKNSELKDKPLTFKVTSDAITVGDIEKPYRREFPYPKTENWQKAIGGHTVYTYAEVTVVPPTAPGEKPTFQVRMTLYAEDRYNFNPGQKDIKTKAPDELRGRLEQVGLGKQFMNRSNLERAVAWQQGNLGDTIVADPNEKRL